MTDRGTGSSEAWYLYNKDTRGSTSSLIDDSGTAATAYEYDAFGNTTIRTGADFDNELCYTGQVYDQSTGLYYYNARFYDPEDGRFLTQDTYRGEQMEPGTWNLYAYCANNPVNYVDPRGHDAIVLKSNFASKWIGHMAVIVQGKYFTWDPSEWRNKQINKNVSKFIRNGKIVKGKKFNKTIGRKSKSKVYRKYIYIKGDFSKSANYIATGNAKASIRNYNLLTTNCAWMAVHVLKKKYSKKSDMYKKLWHMQYSKIWTPSWSSY